MQTVLGRCNMDPEFFASVVPENLASNVAEAKLTVSVWMTLYKKAFEPLCAMFTVDKPLEAKHQTTFLRRMANEAEASEGPLMTHSRIQRIANEEFFRSF